MMDELRIDTADLLAWKKIPLNDYLDGLYFLIARDIGPVVEKKNFGQATIFLELIDACRTSPVFGELPIPEKDYMIRVVLGFVREELRSFDMGFEVTQEEIIKAAAEYREGKEHKLTDEERFKLANLLRQLSKEQEP